MEDRVPSRYERLISGMPLGMLQYRLREEGRLVLEAFNPAAEKILKADLTSRLDKPIEEAFPGLRDTPIPGHYLRLARQGGSWSSEEVTYESGDIAGAYSVVAFQVSPGEVVVLFDDITERKRWEKALVEKEEELRKSEERFRTVADYTADWEYWQSPDGEFLYVSPSCERITGYTRENFYEDPELLDRIICEDDLPLWKDHIRSEISDTDVSRLLFRIRMKSGAIRWIEHSCREVFSSEGRYAGRRAANRDVTERIEAEDAQRRLEEQLLQAQKMEAVGQLAGGVAHDFNNLLQVITGYTALALEELPKGYTTEVEACMGQISRATERARGLIRQLLSFSKHQESRLAVADLNQVISRLIGMIERLLPEAVSLQFTPGASVDPVLIDVGQFEQVILNLSVNASDAMPNGGVLEIRTGKAAIPGTAGQSQPWLREGDFSYIEVSDTGHGMTPEVRDRIFEPFFSTKDVGQGTGLGLSTVYGIVRQHSGFIAVDSSPGGGSTFRVYLPSCRPDRKEVRAVRPETPARGRGELILVAEDDSRVRSLAETILKRNGYQVLTAQSGDEAIQLFRKHQAEIDLVLSDVVMPGQSGRTVLDLVQALAPGLPVILASGYSFNLLDREGVKNPDYDSIQKPFDKDELLHRVRSALDRARRGGG